MTTAVPASTMIGSDQPGNLFRRPIRAAPETNAMTTLLQRLGASYSLGWGNSSESPPIIPPARKSPPRTVAMARDD